MVSEFVNVACLSCIDNGANWLYGSFDKVYFLSSKIMIYLNGASFIDELFNLFHMSYWYSLFNINDNQVLTSVFLDLFLESSIFKIPFIEEWYKSIFSNIYSNSIFIEHPELILIKFNILVDTYNNNISSLYLSLYNNSIYESFNFVIFTVLHYSIFCLILSFIFILYFSNFINLTNELTVDVDYSSTSLLIEAEKEISSIDDLIIFSVCVFYLFGWFFYLNVFTFFATRIYTASLLMILPLFFFTIIGMPTLLIYDFGLFFLVYLRGAGTTSLFMFELMYDYIAVMVFYTRIVVQNIRLLLMFFTLISLHDVFLFFSLGSQNLFKSFNFFEYFNVDYYTDASSSYSFLIILLQKIFILMYEVLHTYFIVLVQFISFFAIVFWLFLFLYTFFVIEKQENYFTYKRAERSLYYKRISNLY